MNHIVIFRKTLLGIALFSLPCVLRAQERGAEELRSSATAAIASLPGSNSESLLRVDFPGQKNWGRVKNGSSLEGRLSLPLYLEDRVVAPTDSSVRVTVSSVKKVREDLGFWRKTGRAIVRAFNPLETNHPTEYRVELSSATLQLPSGEMLPLDARVLRASTALVVRPKVKALKAAAGSKGKNGAVGTLLLALRQEALPSIPFEPNPGAVAFAEEQRSGRAYLLTSLRASVNHQGDTFQAQLAEPVRVSNRIFAPGTIVEGSVVRSVKPRMLSRAGRLSLRVDRIVPPQGEPLHLSGSLSAAESEAQTRFVLDEEGTLQGRKPGVVNGLVDLAYAYVIGKVSDDLSETPIRAIGSSMGDAAVANAARYVGLGSSAVFLITRRGKDVFLPKYALLEIDFGRASATSTTAHDN